VARHRWEGLAPKPDGTFIRIVRFTESLLSESAVIHAVEGVPVKVFGIVKTVADCFRYRNKIGLSVAIEGLQEALRQRKPLPARSPDKPSVAASPL
jgi:hypothetical protein